MDGRTDKHFVAKSPLFSQECIVVEDTTIVSSIRFMEEDDRRKEDQPLERIAFFMKERIGRKRIGRQDPIVEVGPKR